MMKVVVRGHQVPVSEALAAHCVARVDRALHSFQQRVTRVELVLVDVNGKRKGLGQECRLSVELAGAVRLHFRSRARDYYQASARAAWGAGRTLARVLGKRRAQAAGGSPRPEGALALPIRVTSIGWTDGHLDQLPPPALLLDRGARRQRDRGWS